MQYRTDPKSGNQLSVLGFGCMRFPGTAGKIDKVKTESLLLEAYKQGINYFDTAYLYGGSEETVGEIFEKNNLREKVYIATKLPHAACSKKEDFDKYFNIQKTRLRTTYIDYYLIHNIAAYSDWEKLCGLGIREWIADKKAKGEIRQLGFSFHGSQNDFFRLLDDYDWDFTQIQYNYINTHYQAGTAGLKRAAEKGIPVIIMEPLLGGRLAANLPEKAAKVFQDEKPGSTPASWGLRWIWDQPEVNVVLSGMNAPEQLSENIKLASEASPGCLSEKEQTAIQNVITIFNESYKIRCTGCNYCMPCPKGINIPACFAAYNSSYTISRMTGLQQYVISAGVMGDYPHYVSDCVQCGKCESHCPQNIEIRKELKAVKRRLQIPGMKLVVPVAKKFMAR